MTDDCTKQNVLEGRCYAAVRDLLPALEDGDAERFLDHLIDGVIAALRRDPRFSCLLAYELRLLLGNVRAEAARGLAELISGLADVDAAITFIAGELARSSRRARHATMSDAIRHKLEELLAPGAHDGTEALTAISYLLRSPSAPADLIGAIRKQLVLHYRDVVPVEVAVDVIEAAIERGELP